MQIKRLIYGDDSPKFTCNCYAIVDDNSNAIIIDPGLDSYHLVKQIEYLNYKPVAILLTHGHFDHIAGITKILEKWQIPTYIHYLDNDLLNNPKDNCSYLDGVSISIDINAKTVTNKEVLEILPNIKIEVIHTPFHTEGSVCYYLKDNKILFTGDTLFKYGVGRTDLPTSCPRFMSSSLEKLKKLPDEVKIYPGHGSESILGKEKKTNTLFNI